jgi:hypothetical protein
MGFFPEVDGRYAEKHDAAIAAKSQAKQPHVCKRL